MGDKMNGEYFEPSAATFNFNNVTGGADSASGGSGGSGMECMQLRSPPGPFHYLISEQAKSLVALQELQNEVGALLEFRDLVIETFPNLRSKMAPSTPASDTRRDWEPGVRVRRKLAGGGGDTTRTKPQPSVQDSGFSTETSCGKDAHSSSGASASASRSRPLEDDLWALLDVIQRKGVRLRDEAELLRGELDERHSGDTAEESFARALSGGCAECGECGELQRLRCERDALLARGAALEAAAAGRPPTSSPSASSPAAGSPAAGSPAADSPAARSSPLGRLDAALRTPARPPRVSTPDSTKFAAILQESNPVELQRQLLTSTVQNQVYCDRLKRAAGHRSLLMERLERARDLNEDLKFRLEEKSIELEGAKARVRQLEGRARSADSLRDHSSMRDMEPLRLPETRDSRDRDICDTPRRTRPSRIPLHTAGKAAAPRPPSAHSVRSVRSTTSVRSRTSAPSTNKSADKSSVPLRRPGTHDNKCTSGAGAEAEAEAWRRAALYVRRAGRLPPLCANLALELSRSILYQNADSVDRTIRSLNEYHDSLWNGKPQQYFESINQRDLDKDYDSDSLTENRNSNRLV